MASSFNNNLKAEFLGITDNVKILERLSYYSKTLLPGIVVTMEEGFVSDLDSIPECLKGIARASANRYKRAYALHDALYRLWAYYEIVHPDIVPPPEHEFIEDINLKKADLMLDEALKVLGMDAYTRAKLYYGLRAFGSPSKDKVSIENSIECVKIEMYDSIEEAKETCRFARKDK